MWENKHLPAVKSEKQIEQEGKYDVYKRREQILEELEKAHIYIDQLNNKIKNLEKENSQLKNSQNEILKKIEKIEKMVNSGNKNNLEK
jgi:predicted nuclease with TOPRIM domain